MRRLQQQFFTLGPLTRLAQNEAFQQLQSYENGTDRIWASRLQQISRVLEVPVAFFFDGAQR
jgi:hypothetical protein